MPDMTAKGSQPIHDILTAKDVHVEMRDGTKLAADVFRPASKGKFPALLAMSPYGKGIQSLPLAPQAPKSDR